MAFSKAESLDFYFEDAGAEQQALDRSAPKWIVWDPLFHSCAACTDGSYEESCLDGSTLGTPHAEVNIHQATGRQAGRQA